MQYNEMKLWEGGNETYSLLSETGISDISGKLCFSPLKIESATCAGNPAGHSHFNPLIRDSNITRKVYFRNIPRKGYWYTMPVRFIQKRTASSSKEIGS